ncbi:nitroreductase [Mycobacterium sp. ENV421]|uniref:nitroreductase family deazaflavin-dependent oxidoreductase n=1 Tax=Mycobacterium sp. ENV421 TaxID=1213407 RepID=UPI000C9B3B68|nr:nitroreductase family deazaflavin-dependent oxidoreductase [Mycobacterium sp. ENV421]PND59299.1 nitroreductase [Mycobacterium sp. ENV421]
MAGMPQRFPDGHWGREDISPLFKPALAFASTAVGSRVIRALVPLDRRVLRATKGKYTLFGPTSMPELLLTTTGRKSGQPRLSALSYLREGERLLVLGSNFGQQHHPAWSLNLLANPEAVVAINGIEIPATATLVTGPERDAGLARFLAYPMYQAYRTRTDRELRLFALTPR